MVLYFTGFFGLKLMGLFNLVVIQELHGQKVLYFKFLSLYKKLCFSSKFNLLTGTCLIIEKCETKLIPRLTLNFDNTLIIFTSIVWPQKIEDRLLLSYFDDFKLELFISCCSQDMHCILIHQNLRDLPSSLKPR